MQMFQDNFGYDPKRKEEGYVKEIIMSIARLVA